MKFKSVTHSLIASFAISAIATGPLFAEESAPPPEAPKLDTSVQYEARTVYESKFLPGVRLCDQDEVDYRGDFRRVNCQDEDIIHSVSTREEDRYSAGADPIVDDRIEPNGNLLRIKFHKKLFASQPKSSNN